MGKKAVATPELRELAERILEAWEVSNDNVETAIACLGADEESIHHIAREELLSLVLKAAQAKVEQLATELDKFGPQDEA